MCHQQQNRLEGVGLRIARWIWPKGFLPPQGSSRRLGVAASAAAWAITLSGCSLGVTRVQETHFIAVPSHENVNYFRVRIEGSATLSKTKFRSGWFPAEAVDSLYGSADESSVSQAYKVRNEIKDRYNAAISSATQGYLDAAANPNSKPEVIEAWLSAQRRVRATAGTEVALPRGATEIEYDPASNLTVRHAGEKLVFALSSNPDDVLGAIANFSKDAEVGATVLQLADVVRQQSVNDVATTEARNEARSKLDAVLVDHIDATLKAIEGAPTAQDLQREVDSLRLILESVR